MNLPATRSNRCPYLLALALLAVAACSGESGGDDCQAGTELCACVSGQCFAGLSCDPATNLCVASPAPGEDEAALCDRLDTCNYLEPGVSATDCADDLRRCTQDLVSSAYADWSDAAAQCLDLNNCRNFFACQATLPDCIPAGGSGTCVPDGAPCDYCNGGIVCPQSYFGDGACDCECANGTDPDCL